MNGRFRTKYACVKEMNAFISEVMALQALARTAHATALPFQVADLPIATRSAALTRIQQATRAPMGASQGQRESIR